MREAVYVREAVRVREAVCVREAACVREACNNALEQQQASLKALDTTIQRQLLSRSFPTKSIIKTLTLYGLGVGSFPAATVVAADEINGGRQIR